MEQYQIHRIFVVVIHWPKGITCYSIILLVYIRNHECVTNSHNYRDTDLAQQTQDTYLMLI